MLFIARGEIRSFVPRRSNALNKFARVVVEVRHDRAIVVTANFSWLQADRAADDGGAFRQSTTQ
jgi:hypothetical protein